MAFNRRRINPLDLQPRKAVGVSLPFSGDAVFIPTYETKDAIKTNIINYFLTGIGERYMNPTFGTPLRNQLFENITQDSLTNVKDIIRQGLYLYFQDVSPSKMEVEGTPDSNTISFFMSYSIKDTNINDELTINFEV
jgi:phage baseplate assembly protein W